MPTDSQKVHCTMPKQYQGPYPSSTLPSTTPHPYKGLYLSSTMPTGSRKTMITVQPMAQPMTSFRITTPSTAMTEIMTTEQVNPVHVHPETSCKALLEHCTNFTSSQNTSLHDIHQVKFQSTLKLLLRRKLSL